MVLREFDAAFAKLLCRLVTFRSVYAVNRAVPCRHSYDKAEDCRMSAVILYLYYDVRMTLALRYVTLRYVTLHAGASQARLIAGHLTMTDR